MFVPPEQRQPRRPPDDRSPPRRALTRRGEATLLWLVGVFLLLTLLAPIGGSGLLQAVVAAGRYFARA